MLSSRNKDILYIIIIIITGTSSSKGRSPESQQVVIKLF